MKLKKRLINVSRLDGDIARRTFSSNLGFSAKDRGENCKRAAHVAAYAKENSLVIASFISPYRETRDYVRRLVGNKDIFIVQIDCPIEECIRRDPKGMYAQLEDGCFMGNPFTGCHEDAPYETELNPDLVLYTDKETINRSADKIIIMLKSKGYI